MKLPLLAFSVGEKFGHPPFNIVPFLIEIAFGLEDVRPLVVDASPDLGNPFFKIQIGEC